MPHIRYYNSTAPFWDFVASLEQQGAPHPLFGGNAQTAETTNDNDDGGRAGPSDPNESFWGPWGPFAHRGRHGPPPPAGPPPPSGPPPPFEGAGDHEPPSELEGPPRGPNHHGHEHHRHGRREHHGPHARGGRCGRGGRGPRFFAPYGMGPFEPFAQALYGQFVGDTDTAATSEDFKPEVDVFDTAESFVVHVSLAGAKKEDVGVNWNAEKSELSIAGVIHRPGDEEFLKTLAMNERKVGAFERCVRLGSRANPAQVDVDGITAKMEDGVLRIEVPKLDAGYVEIKKVDIE